VQKLDKVGEDMVFPFEHPIAFVFRRNIFL
jgi:hypothetical protein